MDSNLESMPWIVALAVMIDKLGGKVVITQADMDKVAYGRVIEDGDGPVITFSIEQRLKQ